MRSFFEGPGFAGKKRKLSESQYECSVSGGVGVCKGGDFSSQPCDGALKTDQRKDKLNIRPPEQGRDSQLPMTARARWQRKSRH